LGNALLAGFSHLLILRGEQQIQTAEHFFLREVKTRFMSLAVKKS
jgi:hypothetical protein